MQSIAKRPSKIATGAIALLFCASAGLALAKPTSHPGGHPGGGHPGGGHPAPHFSAPHFAAHPHVAPHFAAHPHVAPHFAAHPHYAPHIATHHYAPHIAAHHYTPHAGPLVAHHITPFAHHVASFAHHPLGGADPASFTAHRHFAGDPALRPFFHHGWHPYRHLGWLGPLFWPYAYGDVFYCSLWPSDYCNYDPFWAYGYGDIYKSIFWPYDYADYVQGPSAPARMADLTQGMAQSCTDEAAEVTGWPLNQIQDAVEPNPQQSALLDNLGNAIVKASDEVKSHCPTTVAFTPTDRLAQMKQRLTGLVDAVTIVSPPMAKFYNSLSDEQKARFNDIVPPQPPPSAQASQAAPESGQGQPSQPSIQAQCNASVMAFPGDRIDNLVKPDDAQRAKLQALQTALAQAADTIKAACPGQLPATPPSRLAAIGKHLQAMLQGVETVQPALADFYNSLSDDQKAHFDTMGRQMFAANQ